MRVALVHRKLSLHGGVEKNFVFLMNGLVARGHDVHIYCAKIDAEVPKGVTVHHVGMSGMSTAARYRSFAVNAAVECTTDNKPYDVVQGFDLTLRHNVLRLGRGVMKVYRDVLEPYRSPADRLWRKVSPGNRSLLRLEEEMVAQPGLIVTNSPVVAEEVVQAYGVPTDRIETIPNGIDLKKWNVDDAAKGRKSTRVRFGFMPHDQVILFVGTGFRRKGLDTVLYALPAGCKLLVVGRDSRARRYEREATAIGIGDRVRFVGAHEVTPALYGAADVVALPSRYEPFSNVVLEALACGVPALHPRSGGASVALEQGGLESLILEDPKDYEALEKIITHVLETADWSERCRAAAEAFSEESCLDAYEALYERVREEQW